MRCISLTMGISAAALLAAGPLYAQSANDWAMPANDFANTRYSTLSQINAGNVGKLQVAWTFSTGVLRGHEGNPLVIGPNREGPPRALAGLEIVGGHVALHAEFAA